MKKESVEFPLIDQGARVIIDGLGAPVLQFSATVAWRHPNGALGLSVESKTMPRHVREGLRVTLEYFRSGTLHRINTRVDRVLSETDGAFCLSLARPSKLTAVRARKFPRVDLSLDATVFPIRIPSYFSSESWLERWLTSFWKGRSGQIGREAEVGTLGIGGLRLSDCPYPEKDELFVNLDLAGERIGVPARVVWRDRGSNSAGLEFCGITGETRAVIADFLDHN